jgi:hypothetical protein
MHCGHDPIGGREQNRQTQTATIQSKSVPCEKRLLLQLESCTWVRPCLLIVVKQFLGNIKVCNGNVAGLSLGDQMNVFIVVMHACIGRNANII